MTLGLGRFRDLAAIPNVHDDDYVVRGPKGGLSIVTSEQWSREKWKKQTGQWKEAKQEFLTCLQKELKKDLFDTLSYVIGDDTKPLTIREIKWIVNNPTVRQLDRTPPSVQNPSPSNDAAGEANTVIEPTVEPAPTLKTSPPPLRRIKPTLDMNELKLAQDFDAMEREMAAALSDVTAQAQQHGIEVSDEAEVYPMAQIRQLPKPAKPGALISQQLKPAKPAVRDMSNVFVDPYEVTLSKSPRSARCAADEIPQLDIDKLDREFGELQRQLGEWPSSFTSGQKQVVQSYALMSPAIPIDEMVHVGQLLTVRPGSAMVADIETITINSSALESPAELPPPTASRSWGGAHRRPQIKGPKGKEHEDVPPPKLAKSDHAAAGRIQDKAWRDLNPQFETLLDNVAILTNEAAKAGVGGGKKKAPSEARGTHAETFCAQMFAGPLPDLDAIGTLIGSLGHKTKNPLSVYFKLPNAMQDWLFRMRNAEIKLDVDQVTREIAATFKDLKSDAENIDEILEDRANYQLNRNQREVLEGISNRLNLMLTQYTEKNSEPLIYLGTPLKDLIDRCDKLKAVLPDSLPEINPKHHYLAYYALTKQMGIDADPYTDTATLVRTANRMLKAYHLMRSRLAEGDPWETIFDEASPSDKQLLVEYREARLNGIRREVRNATGVTMEFIDGEDEEKIFYFDSRNEQAIRHANHALRTMAFAMGGTYRLLYDVFGCQERSLEEIEQEREKAEQALGQAQPATA